MGPISRLISLVAKLVGGGGAEPHGAATSATVHRGTVAFWHSDEGWGAVRTPDRPGVGFAHFSQIRGVEGFRELHKNQAVEFEWGGDVQQDGCQYQVAWVRITE